MSTPWLSVVGIGEDGLERLSPAARTLVDGAEVLVGGARHLAMIPEGHPAECHEWQSPLKKTVAMLRGMAGRRVCVLATGDPMSYGVGVTLGREFGPQALTVIPAPGAFSLAAARLGWPLEAVDRLTVHGRPLALLNAYVRPGARLLILSEDGATPASVAALLCARGYPESRLTVFEHMGGPEEAVQESAAAGWGDVRTRDLNTLAVECIAGPDAVLTSRAAGLPDEAFRHDGQLTKREVRAATLARLAPQPDALLWDVGSGAGSVAIEWMRLGGRAVGVERQTDRVAMAAANAEALGAPLLKLVTGAAPDALAGLEAPDAVFIGGGLTDGVAEACWARLKPGGRLVANAVTVEGESVLARLHASLGGEMARIAVSRLEAVGPYHGWRPLMPVTQFAVTKGRAE